MINHLVMFRLKDKESIAKTKEVLESLDGEVPQLRSITVGVNVVDSPRAYDIALVTTFNTHEDLKAYQVHPAHLDVLEYMKKVVDTSVSVDYEGSA